MAGRPVDEMLARLRLDDAEFKRNAAESASVFTKLTALLKKPSDLNMDKSVKSLSSLQNGINNVDVNGLNKAIEVVTNRFSFMGRITNAIFEDMANKIKDVSKQMVSAVTTDGIRDGFREYELKIGNIQTILANTARHGTTLEQVNAVLDDLNTYADRTIYSFADMTRNIGLFTNAGLSVEESTSMIKGFSNEAAASGTNASQAANAAYQLSQALSAGTIRLMDWRSLTNASMGNKNMQSGLIEIAEAMGQFDQGTQKASDVTKDFNRSLETGWLSSEVMSKYLQIMAGDMDKSAMAALGLNEAQIKTFEAQQKMAFDAATKVRTFTQLIDTAKEAIGSGWAQTFEILFGGFDEATELWTGINDAISVFIDKFSSVRNNFLQAFVDMGGKKYIIDGLVQSFRFLGEVAKVVGDAFNKVFPSFSKFFSVESNPVSKWLFGSDKAKEQLTDIEKYANDVILGIYGNGQARVEALEALGLSYERIQDRVNSILLPDYVSKFTDETDSLGQATTRMGRSIKDFIQDSDSGVQQMVNVAKSFKDFFTNLTISDDVKGKLTNIFAGVFSVLDSGLSIIARVGSALGGLVAKIAPVVGGFLLDILDQLATGLIKVNDFITNNSLSSMIESVFSGIAGMLGVSESTISTIIGWFDSLGQSIKNMWDMLTKDGPLASGAGGSSNGGGAAGGGAGGPFAWWVNGLVALRDAFSWVRNGGIGTAAITMFTGISKAIGWAGDKAKTAYRHVSNFMSPILTATKSKVGGWFDATVDWFRNIGDWSARAWPAVKNLVDTLWTQLGGAASGAGDWLGGMADGFKKLGETLWEWFGTGFEAVKGSLSGLWEWLGELAQAPEIAIGKLGEGLSQGITNMQDFFAQMGEFLRPVFDFFGQFSKTDLLWIGSLIGVFYTIKELVKLVNSINAPKTAIGDIFKSVTGMFKSIGSTFKDIGLLAKASKWLTFAISIGILADSLSKLGALDNEQLLKGTAALGAVMLGLVGSMKILGGVQMPSGLGTTMLLFSVALKILGGVIQELGDMDVDALIQGSAVVAGLSAVLGISIGLIGMLNSMTPGSSKGLAGAGVALLGLGIAVKIIGEVIQDLGALNQSQLSQGFTAAASIAGAITVFMMLITGISRINSFGSGIGNAAVMLALVAAVKLLANTVVELGTFDPGQMQRGLWAVGLLAASLGGATGLLTLMSKISGFGAGLGTAISLGTMALSIKELADVAVSMGTYDPGQIQRGLWAVGILAAEISIFSSIATGIAGLSGPLSGINAGISMGALTLATIELADVAMELGAYDPDSMARGLKAIAYIQGNLTLFSGLISGVSGIVTYFTGFAGVLGGTFSLGGLTLATMEIADLVIQLGSMDPGSLERGIAAITIIFGGQTMALLASSLTTLGSGIGAGVTLAALGYGLKSLAEGIVVLGNANPEAISQGLITLGGALTILLTAGAIATYFGLGLGLAAVGVGAAGLGALAAGAGFGINQFAEGLQKLYDLLKEVLGDMGAIVGDLLGWFGGLAEGISDFVETWKTGDDAIQEITMSKTVQQVLKDIETELVLGEGHLSSAAHTAVQGIMLGLQNGEMDIQYATTALTEMLVTQFGLTQTEAEAAAKQLIDAIMTELKMDDDDGTITASAEGAMNSLKDGIARGGAAAVTEAKSWISAINAGLSGVSRVDIPDSRGGKTVADARPSTPVSSPAPVVNTTAQPVVVATPVDMGPAIASMAANAVKMGTTYVKGIQTFVPQSRQSGLAVATSAVTGAMTEMGRFTTTGLTSGRNYGTGVQNTANLSRGAGNLIGTQATSGTRTGSSGMWSAGTESGSRFGSGVSSKGSAAWSAGSSLASNARSGSNSISLYSVGSGLGQGFVNGINSRASAAWSAGANLASASNSGIRSRANMHSPSRLTFATAGDFVAGWVNGIKQRAKQSYAAAAEMTGAAVDAVKAYATSYMDALETEEVYEPTVRPILDLSNVNGLGDMSYDVRASVSTNGMSNNDMIALNSITMDRQTIDLASNLAGSNQRGQNGITQIDQSNHYNVDNDGLFEGATFVVREEADINKITNAVRNTFTKESELIEIFNRGRG